MIMNTIRNLCISVILTILMLFLGIGLTGCSAYREATVIKNGLRFYFEYPRSYSDRNYSLNDKEVDSVDLYRYIPGSKDLEADKAIQVKIWSADANTPSARAFLDGFLEDITWFNTSFKLIDRSPIRVSNIDGEMIVFSEQAGVNLLITGSTKCWDVNLDYKGKICTISVWANLNNAEEAKLDFDHLVQSFKFLNY